MNVLNRGIQSYVLFIGGLVIVVAVWGANLYLFDNSTADVGWPVLLGVAVLLLGIVVGLRRLVATSGGDSRSLVSPYDWNSRK